MEREVNEWLAIIKEMPKEGPGIRGMDFLTTGAASWREIGGIPERGNVLDIGCGHGRMAVPFINTGVKYFGVDILPDMWRWCKGAFAPWNNIEFDYLPVYNADYNPTGEIMPENVVLDYINIDVVIALSLFTHLETEEVAQNYVEQIYNSLKPGGRFVSSWFTSPPNTLCAAASRTVYRKDFVLSLFGDFNITTIFNGETSNWHDQLTIIAEKK